MSAALRWSLGLLAWGAAALAALAINAFPGEYSHALCGPWGCLPPLQALVAMHTFWVVLLVPPTAFALRRLSPSGLRFLGAVVAGGGVVGVAVLIVRDLVAWDPYMQEENRLYVLARAAYAVAMMTDVPLCQLTIAGLVFAVAGLRRGRDARRAL
jgi:hypothetical protein